MPTSQGQSNFGVQSKIYLQDSLFTILKVDSSGIVNSIRKVSDIKSKMNEWTSLFLGTANFTDNKVGYTILEDNHLFSIFFARKRKFSPRPVVLDFSAARRRSEFIQKSIAPAFSDVVAFDISSIKKYYSGVSMKKVVLKYDFAQSDNSIFLTVLHRENKILEIWEASEDLYYLDDFNSSSKYEGGKLLSKIENFSSDDFISFCLNDKLYLVTSSDEIYQYTDRGELQKFKNLSDSYSTCLFVIDKDKNRLSYIKREEFSNIKTTLELEESLKRISLK